MALSDQRRVHMPGGLRRESELAELVDSVGTAAIADTDHGIDHVDRGQVDDAFATTANQLEAVVALPYVTAEQGRREAQHHVPAHGHDVGFILPAGTDQD